MLCYDWVYGEICSIGIIWVGSCLAFKMRLDLLSNWHLLPRLVSPCKCLGSVQWVGFWRYVGWSWLLFVHKAWLISMMSSYPAVFPRFHSRFDLLASLFDRGLTRTLLRYFHYLPLFSHRGFTCSPLFQIRAWHAYLHAILPVSLEVFGWLDAVLSSMVTHVGGYIVYKYCGGRGIRTPQETWLYCTQIYGH